MAKCYIDWEEIEEKDAPVLIDAVARYVTIEPHPSTDVLCAILGIKKEDD